MYRGLVARLASVVYGVETDLIVTILDNYFNLYFLIFVRISMERDQRKSGRDLKNMVTKANDQSRPEVTDVFGWRLDKG
jgi:hypothetical protein